MVKSPAQERGEIDRECDPTEPVAMEEMLHRSCYAMSEQIVRSLRTTAEVLLSHTQLRWLPGPCQERGQIISSLR